MYHYFENEVRSLLQFSGWGPKQITPKFLQMFKQYDGKPVELHVECITNLGIDFATVILRGGQGCTPVHMQSHGQGVVITSVDDAELKYAAYTDWSN